MTLFCSRKQNCEINVTVYVTRLLRSSLFSVLDFERRFEMTLFWPETKGEFYCDLSLFVKINAFSSGRNLYPLPV